MAFLVAIILKNTLYKKGEEPFIIELPEYKVPEAKTVLHHTWEKGKGFLKKAGTIIFAISVIVWFLQSFNMSGMAEIDESFLASIGNFISPIFAPLGFGTWQSSVSLLTGLAAKEVVVSTMGVLYSGELEAAIAANFTTLSALSFLAFSLLYTPCIAVIGAMKKEFGGKFAFFSAVYQIAVAWIAAFLIYNIGGLIF